MAGIVMGYGVWFHGFGSRHCTYCSLFDMNPSRGGAYEVPLGYPTWDRIYFIPTLWILVVICVNEDVGTGSW